MQPAQERLIHLLLDSLKLQTTLFHLGRYCGSWKASTSGLATAGFHLVLAGDCWLHLPESASSHRLETGDAVFFLRDTPHWLSPHADLAEADTAPRCPMQPFSEAADGTGLACGFFSFESALYEQFLGAFPEYVIIKRDAAGLGESRPIFELILNEARQAQTQPSPLITRLVDILFFYVIRYLCQRQEISASLWAVLARPEFAALVAALLDDPARAWSIEEMAVRSHMSRAAFHKHFTQIAGTSPGQFLTGLRMTLARQLLGRGLSLSRTAEQVGYQSDAAFSRAFKRFHGEPAGTVRRSQAN